MSNTRRNLKFDINDCVEMSISNQVIKGTWKLIKKYRNSTGRYYALIECVRCGDRRIVHYYNFYRENPLPCLKCKYLDLSEKEIGKIYGNIKVLSLDHIEWEEYEGKKKGQYALYFLCECTKCHKQTIRRYNPSQWLRTKECKWCKATFENSSYNSLLTTYKQGSSDRNIEWKLTNDEFLSLITQNCSYCGAEPVIRAHDYSVNPTPVMGIDRVDSDKPYEIDNCVPCCTKCNFMKQAHSVEDFLNHVEAIYKFRIKGSETIESKS